MPKLTEPQQRIISHNQGHARVVAVAGAGKTTTLTHFIAARLQEGVSPRRILVLMYNRNAKLDFEQKLQDLLPNQILPEVRTFHSLGLRIYQRLVQQHDLPPFQEKILSDAEIEPLIWRMLQQLADGPQKQDILAQRKKWVEPALGFIDLVKSGLDSPEQVFEQLDLPASCKIFIQLFYQFEQWRKQQRRISYADMLYDPVCFFAKNPQVAAQFGGHMQWMLVDEYQDINAIQQRLLDVVYAGHGAVVVIGDPDQTIYEFRGSKPEFIVSQFDQRMGQVSLYQLPHTFRYGHQLSLMANHLISHNRERDDILCLSHSSTPITQVQWQESNDEAQAVVQLIQEHARQRPLTDIAVICRIWALCAPIELRLLEQGIAYNLHHSQSVLDRSELKIFWLLFELAAGRFAQQSQTQRYESWLHFLTTPYPKIKIDTLKQLASKMATFEQNFGQQLLHSLPDELSQWQKQTLQTRAELLSDIETVRMPAYLLVANYIEQTDLLDGLEDNSFSAQQADDQRQTILAFVAFMRSTKLSSEQALEYLLQLKQQRALQKGMQGVQLISVHKSKGLEWPVVIIPGLNHDYYPYEPEGDFSQPANIESERRLLYVAMTRAQQCLYLLLPKQAVQKAAQKVAQKKKTDAPQASCFQAELQLKRSQQIAQAITKQETTVELNPADGKVADWLERYLAQSGVKLEFKLPAKAYVQAPVASIKALVQSKYGKTKALRRITHQVLGVGAVTFEDDSYLVVQFDNENSPRTFSRSAVQPFLIDAETD